MEWNTWFLNYLLQINIFQLNSEVLSQLEIGFLFYLKRENWQEAIWISALVKYWNWRSEIMST